MGRIFELIGALIIMGVKMLFEKKISYNDILEYDYCLNRFIGGLFSTIIIFLIIFLLSRC